MSFIPLIDRCLLPWWERVTSTQSCMRHLRPSPLRRIGCGMLLASVSFLVAAVLSSHVASSGDGVVPVMWMVPQYAVLAFGEILTSTTGDHLPVVAVRLRILAFFQL